MQHLRKGRKLSRVRKTRVALLKTLLGSFFLHEKMTTTEAKAKEIRPMVERLISKAKLGANADRRVAIIRELQKSLPLVAIRKIVGGTFLERVSTRTSGYTRLIKVGNRKGDNAKMSVIELV